MRFVLAVGRMEPTKAGFVVHRMHIDRVLDLVGVEALRLNECDLCAEHLAFATEHHEDADIGHFPVPPITATQEVGVEIHDPVGWKPKRCPELCEVRNEGMVERCLEDVGDSGNGPRNFSR